MRKLEIRSDKGDEGYTIDKEYENIRGFFITTAGDDEIIRIYVDFPKTKDLKPFEPPIQH